MTNIPENLKYTATHEWVREEQDGVLTIGITEHAQHLLGDMVFVELPEFGTHIESGAECCVAESVKAAADVYSPLSGEIIAVNERLINEPGLVNADPYGEGWLFQLKPSDNNTLANLMTAQHYAEQIAGS